MSIPGMNYFLSGTIFDKPTKELNLFYIFLNLISEYFFQSFLIYMEI